MVSLSMMARLVEAVRPDARLVLVGDPGQLTSIEAGAVLGDIVGPAVERLRMRPEARSALVQAVGGEVAADDPPEGVCVGDGIVVLERVHRFGGGIASAGRGGPPRRRRGERSRRSAEPEGGDVTWIPVDAADPEAQTFLAPVRAETVGAARAVIGRGARG